jgi:hypothetical protein
MIDSSMKTEIGVLSMATGRGFRMCLFDGLYIIMDIGTMIQITDGSFLFIYIRSLTKGNTFYSTIPSNLKKRFSRAIFQIK